MLTVIIPTTGDRPDLLNRALVSVERQTEPPSAVLVVVDGDESVAQAVRHRVSDVTVLCTGARRGVSGARNLGAEHATTRMLAFLDDDDAWKCPYLEAAMTRPADVVLTAFEKHNQRGAAPEKVPPQRLAAEDFLVRNPGLRGSNLIIRKAVYEAVGGFDPWFPAMNDLDFGVRLWDAGPWSYQRNTDPLVEFHRHEGLRLSTAGSPANRLGLQRFWRRYHARMTGDQGRAFRERAVKLWGLDPFDLAQDEHGQH